MKTCKRCVMDFTASNITFDASGNCNFCTEFQRKSKLISNETKNLDAFVGQIPISNDPNKYNCIVGVSGGVDSAWTLVKAKELGLKPLAVHMDNGWNSELAQNNIENLVSKLNVDLHTYVVNWNEYRNLMNAFFLADVIDIEILYDNAMLGVCYQQAKKYGIKHIISGSNFVTEGMEMPQEWNWYKRDVSNIKSIARTHGVHLFKSFPFHSTFQRVIDEVIFGIKWIPFLDYLPYEKQEALDVLTNDYGYQKYPYKHYESIFTRFYQGFILPNKFNVDKRKLHFSNLIMSDQMDRKAAIELLKTSPYPVEKDLERDKAYFLKKMRWSASDLEEYLNRPPVSHKEYRSEQKMWFNIRSLGMKLGKKSH